MSSLILPAKFKKAILPVAFGSFLLTIAALLACTNVGSKPSINKPMSSSATGLHVVELFTSEGCSSCPAADRLLSKLKAEGDSSIIVLSYHVDYWDYIGWKDPFSQAAFSNRQREYAQRFGLESIYTPQVIVNGGEEFVGSDEKRLRTSLAKGSNASVAIKASAKIIGPNNLQLSYSLPTAQNLLLNVALVQAAARTEVKRGENSGRTLDHVNVVREFKTMDAKPQGIVEIELPDGLKTESLSVIIFVQDKSNGKITGATRAAIPSQKGA